MEIFDMHVHAKNTSPDPERLLKELSMAGVSGCTVFSNRPIEENPKLGAYFTAKRICEILDKILNK